MQDVSHKAREEMSSAASHAPGKAELRDIRHTDRTVPNAGAIVGGEKSTVKLTGRWQTQR